MNYERLLKRLAKDTDYDVSKVVDWSLLPLESLYNKIVSIYDDLKPFVTQDKNLSLPVKRAIKSDYNLQCFLKSDRYKNPRDYYYYSNGVVCVYITVDSYDFVDCANSSYRVVCDNVNFSEDFLNSFVYQYSIYRCGMYQFTGTKSSPLYLDSSITFFRSVVSYALSLEV